METNTQPTKVVDEKTVTELIEKVGAIDLENSQKITEIQEQVRRMEKTILGTLYEHFGAHRAKLDQLIQKADWLGEFCATNSERCEDIRNKNKDLGESGEKIRLPAPEKLSGEDSSVDIRLRLKQIERFLHAKRQEEEEDITSFQPHQAD